MRSLAFAAASSALLVIGCATGQSLLNRALSIDRGQTRQQVIDDLGAPRDKQVRGDDEAWQYCRSGLWLHEYVVVWFHQNQVTGVTTYRLPREGADPEVEPLSCSYLFRTVRWEEAPERTIGAALLQLLRPSVTPPVPGQMDPLCPDQGSLAPSPVQGPQPKIADVEDLLRRAAAGDAEAQSTLGWTYYVGNRVAEDPVEAVKWLRMAAEQGSASGQNWLGMAFEEGKGVPKDEREAVAWYQRAADQGEVLAQLNLARKYNYGVGVPKDHAQAAVWYCKAAQQGHPGAQSDLGVAYDNGEGVQRDMGKAERWFTKASEQGYGVASYYIGRMYWDGDFGRGAVLSSIGIAYFRKAAAEGYPVSALVLAEIYSSRTRFVSRDDQRACMWTVVAEELNRRGGWEWRPDDTVELRRRLPGLSSRLRKNLTEQQLIDCERPANEWLAAYPPRTPQVACGRALPGCVEWLVVAPRQP